MTLETLPPLLPPDPGLESIASDVTPEKHIAYMDAAREAELRRLLDPPVTDHYGKSLSYGNYDYACSSGLIDEFAHDPEKGYDGLMHILVGQARKADGKMEVGGFHINHDPDYVGEVYHNAEDRSDIDAMSGKHRRQYIVRPFEPRKAQVVVSGYKKDRFETDKEGKQRPVRLGSTMFPAEYDPLAALQAIRIAKNSRDRSADIVSPGKIEAVGMAPMIDGKTQMPIRLIMTSDEKIITAYPRVKEAGYMKLSHQAVQEVLYGN